MQPRCVSPAGSQGRGLQNSEETQGVPSPRVLPVTLGAHHRVREEERDLKARMGPRKPQTPGMRQEKAEPYTLSHEQMRTTTLAVAMCRDSLGLSGGHPQKEEARTDV